MHHILEFETGISNAVHALIITIHIKSISISCFSVGELGLCLKALSIECYWNVICVALFKEKRKLNILLMENDLQHHFSVRRMKISKMVKMVSLCTRKYVYSIPENSLPGQLNYKRKDLLLVHLLRAVSHKLINEFFETFSETLCKTANPRKKNTPTAFRWAVFLHYKKRFRTLRFICLFSSFDK